MKNKLLSMLLILVASGISAKKIPVMDVLYYSVPAEKPILCDSVNVKGEAFMPSSLLDLWMEGQDAASPVNRFTVLKAASDSTFSLRKPASGYLLSLWKYYLMPDNYLPLKLKFQSACAFEVYVDGEKKLTKTTVENRREKAIVKTVELDADPRQYVVLVKMLASATDSCQVSLSLNVETEARDSLSKLTASSSDKRRLYIPDMSTGKRILNTSVSPNGQFALINYSLIYKNGTRSQYAELYRLPEGKQLWTDNSNRNLSWMPKTNALYYTIKGYEGNELRQLDPVTLAETVLVKNLPEGDFTWSPQEHFLIYTIAESAKEDQSDLRRFLSPEDRQPGFRSRSSLYLYDLKTGLRKRLTWGKETTWLNDISPDETAVLFGENRIAITKEPYTTSSLFRLNLQTMKTDTIWQEDKFAINAQFSPDGRQLFMTGGPDAFGGIGLNVKPGQKANQFDVQGFIMDLASKKIRPVTKTFNPSILSADWSKADGKIYLRVEDKDYQRIYAYDPFKDTYQLLPLSPDIVSTFDLSKTARMAVYSGSTVNYTGKAYAIDLKSNKETLLANPGAQRLASVEFGQIKDWNFQAPDSTTIDGRFYLPPNFDPSKKYPMLVYYYGGTSPTARNFESSYPLTMWAAQGYIVYTLQPSGTTGFGQAFSARHVNAWGDYTADEIITGTTRFYREHTFVDSTRIGCFGASYGGFMTMYLLTKTNLFKTAISHAGISAISSYWGEGFWGYSYSAAASTGSWPWNNPALYAEHSPLFNADKINTPLLLLHGTEDTNVPIGESIQMYTALKILGKEVQFVRVLGENHGIVTYEKRKEWQRTQMAWFAKYLKGDDRWWNALYPSSVLEK